MGYLLVCQDTPSGPLGPQLRGAVNLHENIMATIAFIFPPVTTIIGFYFGTRAGAAGQIAENTQKRVETTSAILDSTQLGDADSKQNSGADQADAYLNAIEDAGGWDSGDIIPIIDAERGDETNSNHTASKQQVIDCVSDCADRLKSELGCRVMLYGRGTMRDLHIAEKMSCDVAWNASYTEHMVRNGLEAFDLEEIVLWQYCGDNVAFLPGYPDRVEGFSLIDISVFIKGALSPTLEDVREALLKEPPP